MRTVFILGLALLAGCQTETVVRVPVAVPCVRDAPARPLITPNEHLAALPDDQLILTIAAERLEQAAYASEASAIIAACR